jgi:hypothetical protein
MRHRDRPGRCLPNTEPDPCGGGVIAEDVAFGEISHIEPAPVREFTYSDPFTSTVPLGVTQSDPLAQTVTFAIAQPDALTEPTACATYSCRDDASTATASSASSRRYMRRPVESVGIQPLRSRVTHIQPAFDLLQLLLSMREHLLDRDKWIRRAMRER